MPGDDVQLVKDGIEESQPHLADLVLQCDFQRLHVVARVGVHRRKSAERRFAVGNGMGNVTEIRNVRPVRMDDLSRG